MIVKSFTIGIKLGKFDFGNGSSVEETVTFESPDGIPEEDFELLQLEKNYCLFKTVLRNAVMTGTLSKDEAGQRMAKAKEAYETFRKGILDKKLGS